MADTAAAALTLSPASAVPRISAETLFDAGMGAYAQARSRAGGSDADLVIAERVVRLEFAGPAMGEQVIPPLQGAQPANPPLGQPSLTIRIWDTKSTGVSLPPGSWPGLVPGPLGLMDELCDDRFLTLFDTYSSMLMIMDRAVGEAFWFVPDPESLPQWELAHPARVLFADWAGSRGLRMCHAAAVGAGGVGVLAPGPSGSGKSTIALACLAASLTCAGDDYVLMEMAPPPRAHFLYGSMLLHHDHVADHPELFGGRDDAGRLKKKAMTFRHREDGLEASLLIEAIVVPRVVGSGPTEWTSVSAAEALRALAPNSLLQTGVVDDGALGDLAALCRSLPCFSLTLGAEISDIPVAIGKLLGELGSGGAT